MVKRSTFPCLLLLFFSMYGYGQWVPVYSAATFYDELTDMEFISADTGLVTGRLNYQSSILMTTNGGGSWDTILSPSGEGKSMRLQRISGNRWHGVEGRDFMRSTDGGLTWTVASQIAPSVGFLYDFVFPTDSVGYVAYFNPSGYFKTTDAGTSWSPVNFPLINLGSIITNAGIPTQLFTFIAADTGFVCGSASCIQRTYDGGQTWDSVLVPGTGHYFIQFEPLAGQNAYALTDSIHSTTDGGQSWSNVGPGATGEVFDFPSRDTAFFAACQYVPMTTLYGNLKAVYGVGSPPVTRYNFPYGPCLVGMQFLDSKLGYAIRYDNPIHPYFQVYRTENGAVHLQEKMDARDHVKVWPQPASDRVRLQLMDGLRIHEMVLYDMQGASVMRVHVGNAGEAEVNVNGLAPGLYVAAVRDVDGNVFFTRVIVE